MQLKDNDELKKTEIGILLSVSVLLLFLLPQNVYAAPIPEDAFTYQFDLVESLEGIDRHPSEEILVFMN